MSVVSTPKNTGIASLSGNSLNNIMGFGFTNGRETFFHWNGQKWSDEKVGGEDFTDFFIQKMINDNYVCGIKYGQISTAFLYRGYRKH